MSENKVYEIKFVKGSQAYRLESFGYSLALKIYMNRNWEPYKHRWMTRPYEFDLFEVYRNIDLFRWDEEYEEGANSF